MYDKSFSISRIKKRITINGVKYNIYTKEEFNIKRRDKFGLIGVGDENDEILNKTIIKIILLFISVNLFFLFLYIANEVL
jgi:hypothetical protein